MKIFERSYMRENMKNLLEKVSKTEGCIVIKGGHTDVSERCKNVPADVVEFYKLCGGAVLFVGSEYEIEIVRLEEFLLANPVIVGELCEEDISSQWYIIAKDLNNEYITIDTNSDRLGRCYDSFWDRHGVVGECSIIANSFCELVESILEYKGRGYYWLDDDFVSLGDAYEKKQAD